MNPTPPNDEPCVDLTVEGVYFVLTATDGWTLRLPLELELGEAIRRLRRFLDLCSGAPPGPGGRERARSPLADPTDAPRPFEVRREFAHPN